MKSKLMLGWDNDKSVSVNGDKVIVSVDAWNNDACLEREADFVLTYNNELCWDNAAIVEVTDEFLDNLVEGFIDNAAYDRDCSFIIVEMVKQRKEKMTLKEMCDKLIAIDDQGVNLIYKKGAWTCWFGGGYVIANTQKGAVRKMLKLLGK